jgi:hypothetical protein
VYSSRNREILQASRERNHMRDTKRDDLRCSTSPGNAMSDPYCVQSVCSSNISDASRGQQDPIGLKQQPEYCVRIARCSYFEQGTATCKHGEEYRKSMLFAGTLFPPYIQSQAFQRHLIISRWLCQHRTVSQCAVAHGGVGVTFGTSPHNGNLEYGNRR